MRIGSIATAGITLVLAATLAACGGGDDDSATAQENPAAAADPNANSPGAGGNLSPGSGADAYSADDKFVPGNNKITDVPPRTIIFADFKFFPDKIDAKAGETWTEDNQDIALHNVSTAAPAGKGGKNGDIAPDVAAGEKQTFKMPAKAGKYDVVCYYHGNMTATITVK